MVSLTFYKAIIILIEPIEENNKAMLTNKNGTKDGKKDSYNVLPTLLLMGKSSSGVQRHIVRAIDNLSSNSK